MFGLICTVTLCAAGMVADVGVTLKNSGVFDPAAVKLIGSEVRFEMVNVCTASVEPGLPVNTIPLGETMGGAEVPAGTIFSTIAMVTGGCTPSVGESTPSHSKSAR